MSISYRFELCFLFFESLKFSHLTFVSPRPRPRSVGSAQELLALILMWPLLLVAARVGGIVTHLEHDQSTGPRHIRHVGRSTKGSW